MMSKTVTFDHNGGVYTQKLKIRGTSMPWRYECDSEWINVTCGATSITVSVGAIYDYNDRNGSVRIFDKFDNCIELRINQTGYRNLSVECADVVVVSHENYETSDTFDTYITVYGGLTQKLSCDELLPYTEMVWDNSGLYNDFILGIPRGLSGIYTIRHSDADDYIKYCNENGIEYDVAKLERTITILQVTEDDKVGSIVIEHNGCLYSGGDNIEISVNSRDWTVLRIVSCEYIKVISPTEVLTVDSKLIDLSLMAQWVDYTTHDGFVKLKAKSENNFTTRRSKVRLTNRTNKMQYIDITVVQEPTDLLNPQRHS